MSSFWKISLAVALMATLPAADLLAWAQPADGPAGNMKPAASIQVVSVGAVNDELTLTGRFENTAATEALGKIARLGNLQIIVPGRLDGKIGSLRFEKVSPEDALKKICAEAHFSCQRVEGVWAIDWLAPEAATKDKTAPKSLALSFSNVAVRDLVGIIAEQFVVSVQVDPLVSGVIAAIRLDEISPEKAIEKIAQAADLELTKEGDQFFLKPKRMEMVVDTPIGKVRLKLGRGEK